MDYGRRDGNGGNRRVRKDHGQEISDRGYGLGFTLVTDNEKEFTRVRDLARENWLR
jgi:endo-1,4-beta-D-glucanase Y